MTPIYGPEGQIVHTTFNHFSYDLSPKNHTLADGFFNLILSDTQEPLDEEKTVTFYQIGESVIRAQHNRDENPEKPHMAFNMTGLPKGYILGAIANWCDGNGTARPKIVWTNKDEEGDLDKIIFELAFLPYNIEIVVPRPATPHENSLNAHYLETLRHRDEMRDRR